MPTPTRVQQPFYLGDGAYVKRDKAGILLYTSNGLRDTNHVVLGGQELVAFLDWLVRMEILHSWEAP